MSSFVRIVFSSYEVILYVIFRLRDYSAESRTGLECVCGLGSILFRAVKNSGSTDANDFCFYNPIDVHILLERGSQIIGCIVKLRNDVFQLYGIE
jgi:hypothetical protein